MTHHTEHSCYLQLTTNTGVVGAWKRGEAARNGAHTLWTDGKTLYSYNVIIGKTIGKKKIAFNPNKYVGKTFLSHMSLAVGVADEFRLKKPKDE